MCSVRGHSMEPTFKEGQYILASSIPYWFSRPKVGDVVVTIDPKSDDNLLKRIIKVENGSCWVEGDNKKDSHDSRKFGWILRNSLLGKAIT